MPVENEGSEEVVVEEKKEEVEVRQTHIFGFLETVVNVGFFAINVAC